MRQAHPSSIVSLHRPSHIPNSVARSTTSLSVLTHTTCTARTLLVHLRLLERRSSRPALRELPRDREHGLQLAAEPAVNLDVLPRRLRRGQARLQRSHHRLAVDLDEVLARVVRDAPTAAIPSGQFSECGVASAGYGGRRE